MRTTLITLGLLFLIGGGAFVYLFFSSSSEQSKWYATPVQKVPVTYAESVQNAQKTEESDIAQSNTAVEKQDITLCDAIVSESQKSECRDLITAAKAQSSDNLELCSTLSSSGIVTSCQDNIYVARADTKMDKALCEKVDGKNLRIYCERQVDTARLKDAQTKNTLSNTFCTSLISELQEDCTRSLVRTDDTSVYQTAIQAKDPKQCDTLTDVTFRNNCHDAIVLQLALSEQKSDYCDSIIDGTKQSYCKATLTKKSDAVRFQEIVAAGDVSGCNTFSEKNLQYQCSDMITMAQVRSTRNQNLCGNLFNTGMQFACMQIANAGK